MNSFERRMHIHTTWMTPPPDSASHSLSYTGHLCLQHGRQMHTDDHHLTHAFVTQNGVHVVVTLDRIPIRSFSVTVTQLRSQSPPHRVHFGSSFETSHQWINPSDLFFNSPVPPFHTSYRFCDPFPQSLSFVIQCSDSQWIRAHGGADFLVGSFIDQPCVVEYPLNWPIPQLAHASQLVSFHQVNPFWLVPHFPNSFSGCMNETVFVLAKLDRDDSHVEYCAMMFCVDPETGLRSTLFSTHAGPAVRIETGLNQSLKKTQLKNALVSLMCIHDNPYLAVQSLIRQLTKHGFDVSPRLDKLQSSNWSRLIAAAENPLFSNIGFCTWDAFDHSVSHACVTQTVKWFEQNKFPVAYVIVDDGWQTVSSAQHNSKHRVLASFDANEKFPHSLQRVCYDTRLPIYAWTTIVGYWSGVTESIDSIRTLSTRGLISTGLHRNNVEDLSVYEGNYCIPYPDSKNLRAFFTRYFTDALSQQQGVSGLKIDAQSVLSYTCGGLETVDREITRFHTIKLYRECLSEIAQQAFGDMILINCMSCAPEIILSSGRTLSSANICWRTSNDHAFPNVDVIPSAVAWHIVSNALNTLILGEIFPFVDWDMMRIGDTDRRLVRLHVIARVLSGGPIYISDKTPFRCARTFSHAREVIRSLVHGTDGRILRCIDVGRPTIDSLFLHPMECKLGEGGARAFKVFNRNSVNGIIAVFNLSSGGDGKTVEASYEPADILDFALLLSERGSKVGRGFQSSGSALGSALAPASTPGKFVSVAMTGEDNVPGRIYLHQGIHDECPITVKALHVAVVHVCPVFKAGAGFEVCVVGQARYVNCGGAVESVTVDERSGTLWVGLRGAGETLVWVRRAGGGRAGARCEIAASGGAIVAVDADEDTGEAGKRGALRTVDVGGGGPYGLRVRCV